MTEYLEPILAPLNLLDDPVQFQGGSLGFDYMWSHERGRDPIKVHALDYDEDVLAPFMKEAELAANGTQIMGIVNVTPDSFSDGGQYNGEDAVRHARTLVEAGAHILDFGAESTRPGAETVPIHEEMQRLEAVFDALDSFGVPTSIDTRKAQIADEAIGMGATMINDVSALSFDPEMAEVVAQAGVHLCMMHAQGDPKTMQDKPTYDNVLLDVYDYLEARITFAEDAGIDRSNIIVDPGIGFGKTLAHNISILKHVAIFHGLGCPLLVGASRKRMIGDIGGGEADSRLGGSLAIALDLARKGVQIIRVHDVYESVQAIKLQNAILRDTE